MPQARREATARSAACQPGRQAIIGDQVDHTDGDRHAVRDDTEPACAIVRLGIDLDVAKGDMVVPEIEKLPRCEQAHFEVV